MFNGLRAINVSQNCRPAHHWPQRQAACVKFQLLRPFSSLLMASTVVKLLLGGPEPSWSPWHSRHWAAVPAPAIAAQQHACTLWNLPLLILFRSNGCVSVKLKFAPAVLRARNPRERLPVTAPARTQGTMPSKISLRAEYSLSLHGALKHRRGWPETEKNRRVLDGTPPSRSNRNRSCSDRFACNLPLCGVYALVSFQRL